MFSYIVLTEKALNVSHKLDNTVAVSYFFHRVLQWKVGRLGLPRGLCVTLPDNQTPQCQHSHRRAGACIHVATNEVTYFRWFNQPWKWCRAVSDHWYSLSSVVDYEYLASGYGGIWWWLRSMCCKVNRGSWFVLMAATLNGQIFSVTYFSQYTFHLFCPSFESFFEVLKKENLECHYATRGKVMHTTS